MQADVREESNLLQSLAANYFKDAPAEYVKFFVCGLAYQIEGSEQFDAFLSDIGMTIEQGLSALEYWQNKGLIRVANGSKVRFEFLLKPRQLNEQLYTETDYNAMLQKVFGMRVLNSAEYARIYDFTEIFKLPRDVVLLLLEYCIKKKGKAVSLSYVEKVAKSWAEEGVSTIEEASEKINQFDLYTSGACKVLSDMGEVGRLPSRAESALYNKWTKEWGFSLDAVRAACDRMTGIHSPNFKYLDGILKNLYENGATTSRQIRSYSQKTVEEARLIREAMRALGVNSRTVTAEQKKHYAQWKAWGFGQEEILYAAGLAARHNKTSLAYVSRILENLKKQGLMKAADMKRQEEAVNEENLRIKEVFHAAGIRKSPTAADREKYRGWLKRGMTQEVMLFAARKSCAAKSPYQYLDKLITQWGTKGISSVAAAQPEQREGERDYTDEQLMKLTTDIAKGLEE